MTNLMSYTGKRVVIAGCYSGMGEACARILTDLGAEVHGADIRTSPVALASFTELDLKDWNAIEQVVNIAQTTVMLDAWGRGQKVTLHGWCYGLKDGLINNLHMTVDSTEGLDALYRAAIAGVAAARRG